MWDCFSLNWGIYQGRPDGGRSLRSTGKNLVGPMVIIEPALHYEIAERPGHFRLGEWWNGDRFDKFDNGTITPGRFGEGYGWYLSWDQLLWQENPKIEDDDQGIGLFGQYGWAPQDRTEVEYYFGGGFQWIGAFPLRDEDILGIGAFHVGFSDEAGVEEGGETAIEVFYKAQMFEWMTLKPDIQYITNPGGSSNKDALAAGIRLEVLF